MHASITKLRQAGGIGNPDGAEKASRRAGDFFGARCFNGSERRPRHYVWAFGRVGSRLRVGRETSKWNPGAGCGCTPYACLRENGYVAQAITRDLETMHGVPVFRGTRVPVQTLFEYLEGGDTLEDFLAGFPTVPRALALDTLEEAKQLLLARA